MKSKLQKSGELKSLKDKLPKSKITVFTSFSKAGEKGLSVAQMTELKRLLRSLKSEYFVTKKTLIDLAVKGKQYDGLDVYGMEGSVGLVLGDDDPYIIAKKVYEFSRKNTALHFWGAIMDGKFVGKDGFLEIAKMPSREVLIERLVGMLTYPMRGLAITLSEVASKRTS
ncbi:MAG: 50S ribosomal protein L10 [bacterium]|nr:50S ribosomal protein L10 [bacterium]